MNGEIYEYRIEFKNPDTDTWLPLCSDITDANEAKMRLARIMEFSNFKYRLSMRVVSPWCECIDSDIIKSKTEENV